MFVLFNVIESFLHPGEFMYLDILHQIHPPCNLLALNECDSSLTYDLSIPVCNREEQIERLYTSSLGNLE
jgi:hypothetical protein